jgi:hypothetical protein
MRASGGFEFEAMLMKALSWKRSVPVAQYCHKLTRCTHPRMAGLTVRLGSGEAVDDETLIETPHYPLIIIPAPRRYPEIILLRPVKGE